MELEGRRAEGSSGVCDENHVALERGAECSSTFLFGKISLFNHPHPFFMPNLSGRFGIGTSKFIVAYLLRGSDLEKLNTSTISPLPVIPW